MRDILSAVMIALCIGWAVYGIAVFWSWDKVAKKADKLMDEMREMYRKLDS